MVEFSDIFEFEKDKSKKKPEPPQEEVKKSGHPIDFSSILGESKNDRDKDSQEQDKGKSKDKPNKDKEHYIQFDSLLPNNEKIPSNQSSSKEMEKEGDQKQSLPDDKDVYKEWYDNPIQEC